MTATTQHGGTPNGKETRQTRLNIETVQMDKFAIRVKVKGGRDYTFMKQSRPIGSQRES